MLALSHSGLFARNSARTKFDDNHVAHRSRDTTPAQVD